MKKAGNVTRTRGILVGNEMLYHWAIPAFYILLFYSRFLHVCCCFYYVKTKEAQDCRPLLRRSISDHARAFKILLVKIFDFKSTDFNSPCMLTALVCLLVFLRSKNKDILKRKARIPWLSPKRSHYPMRSQGAHTAVFKSKIWISLACKGH